MSNFNDRPHSLLAYPFYSLDNVASRLSIITSTPQGTDSLLKTICFALQFLSGSLTDLSSARAQALVAQLAARAKLVLLPGETLMVSVAPASSLVTKVGPRAKALSSLVSEFRTFTRLWGLLGMYSWAKGLVVSPPRDTLMWMCAWIQCFAYTGYQFLENRAYLAGKGIITREGGSRAIIADWLWSTRCWMVAVGVEFIRLLRARTLRMRKVKTGEMTLKEAKEERDAWWRDLFVNCTNVPLTVHWSVEGGTLTETQVGLLATVGGAVGFRERWKAAGKQIAASRAGSKA